MELSNVHIWDELIHKKLYVLPLPLALVSSSSHIIMPIHP